MITQFLEKTKKFNEMMKDEELVSHLKLFGIVQGSVVCFLMSVAVSTILYRNKMIEFNNSETIKNKNKELKSLNSELGGLNNELKKLSTIDYLTNVSNRRKFEEVLRNEWSRAMREKTKISIILLDIDFFKSYNDFYGHAEGDNCLQAVGKVLRSAVKRKHECVARYGGEEFACILPNTSITDAYKLSEIIRKGIISENIKHEKSSIAKVVTASFGVCCATPTFGLDVDEFVRRADEALYVAKEGGRNTVEIIEYNK